MMARAPRTRELTSMHRLYFGLGLSALVVALFLTGCGQKSEPQLFAQTKDEPVSPGEAKPIPPKAA